MAVELACRDLGVACRTTLRGQTTEELLATLTAHARTVHGVELTETLADYAADEIRTVG